MGGRPGMGSPWQQQLQECGLPCRLQLQGAAGGGAQTRSHRTWAGMGDVEHRPRLGRLGKGQSQAYGCSQHWFQDTRYRRPRQVGDPQGRCGSPNTQLSTDQNTEWSKKEKNRTAGRSGACLQS